MSPTHDPPALSRSAALFLDFDGTLVELAARPDAIRVPADLGGFLERLARHLDGALAIVTGRSLAAVDGFLEPLRLPGAGIHGAELRLCATHAVLPVAALDLRAAAADLQAQFAGDGGILVEDKGTSLSVHYRQSPARAADVEQALRRAVADAAVEVVAGKFVFEARPRGLNKGSAVHALMAVPPFAGRLPVFLGDDLTDEDGIAAAQALGGLGIKVGEGASGARGRLANPAAVRTWLATACDGGL